MKSPKKYHTILAAASIGLAGIIPATFGGEKEPAAKKAVPASLKIEDRVHARLNGEIVGPLNLMADRSLKFSRRMPTESTRYHLAETENPVKGERSFKVVKTSTPLLKGGKASTLNFLKIRYLENTSMVLVDLKDQWVKVEEHPVLKSFPKLKPTPEKITP